MKVLVTGGAGFIGSHLAEKLLSRGDEVVVMDNFNDYYDPARKRRNVAPMVGKGGFSIYEADFRDEEAVRRIFSAEKPTHVAHLGAMAGVRYSIGRAALYNQVNYLGTIHLLDAARDFGCENFVFASTSSVYGKTVAIPFREEDPCNHPLAPYPATKKACEVLGYAYHNLHGLNFTALRFFSVYGPRGRPDMMPYIVTDRIFRQQKITLFDAGQMKRDWTYIDDIVDGVVLALERPLGYEVINLGRGEPVLMSDFVEIIEEITGKNAILETPPAPPSEPFITFAEVSRARRLLDYDPKMPVREGLQSLWEWYRREVAGEGGRP